MKSGICPKCESEEVFVDYGSRNGIVIPVGMLLQLSTNLYVCADCGYLEFYTPIGFDLQRVKEKYRKVKK